MFFQNILLLMEVLVLLIILGVNFSNASPFPNPQSSWIIHDGYNYPYLQSFVGNKYLGNGIKSIQNNGGCENSKIPCSGHTKDSCTRFCQSIGFPLGTCQRSCCLCTHTNIHEDIYSGFGQNLNQFRGLRELSNTNTQKIEKIIPTSILHEQRENNNQISDALPQGVCSSDICMQAAKEIKFNMNPKMDPCTNFYEYACGGFIKNTRIPQDQTEMTRFSMLQNKVTQQLNTLFKESIVANEPAPFKLAKTFYRSCMNKDIIERKGIEPMKDVIGVLGGWPVVEGVRWQPQYFTWSNFVAWFRELGYTHNLFLKISVDPDVKNVNRRILTIGEPDLGLEREVFIKGMNDPNVQAYYKYMVNSAILFGAPRYLAETEMLKTVKFEMELAKNFYRTENSRLSTYYVPATISELEKQYPSVPWFELFQRLLPESISLNTNDVVIVTTPHFLQAFIPLVESTDIRTVSNYAIWKAVASSMSYLNDDARKLQHRFSAMVTGQVDRVSRWRECTGVVSASLVNAVGAMYIRRYFDNSSKTEAEDMINNIHNAFLTILDKTEWMDSKTRYKAREKALATRIHVAYPPEHLRDAPITELYKDFRFQEDDYLGNVRNLVLSSTNLSFGKLRSPINKNDWTTHGKNSVVNAFYHPLENSIQMTAGILQSPFFDRQRPKYLNYGAIGWITGHEITHGFDDQGHQFDKDGNLANWWDPFTLRTYTSKTQCIIKQYGNFNLTDSNLKVNGVNTQGENIADNGGIKQAYLGYLSWVKKNGEEKTLPGFETLNPKQLFWISAANNWCSVYRSERLKSQIISGVHSPGEFRVLGTFTNNDAFARDFGCPRGSPMNPLNKCDIW